MSKTRSVTTNERIVPSSMRPPKKDRPAAQGQGAAKRHGGGIPADRPLDFMALSGFLGRALPRNVERRRMMAGVARHVKGMSS